MNTSVEPGPRRRVGLIFAVLFVIIVLVTIAPVVSALIAGTIADLNGCMLDEGSVHPCIVLGSDRGEILYAMGVAGWLALITLPIGGIALLAWFIALVVTLVLRRRAPRQGGV